MHKQMDEKELVITALASIDGQIVATDFMHDWQSAIDTANCNAVSHGQIPGRLRRFFSGSFSPVGATVLTVAIFSVGLATLLFNNTETQKEIVLEPMEGQVVPVSLDPNRPWYGPTDDLLQVAVLYYGKQWPTYAIYDPLTMEIK